MILSLFVFLDEIKLLKYVDLRKTPSLEFGLMLTFSYLPYALAEGIHLSGEMTNTSIIISLNQTFLSLKIWYRRKENTLKRDTI